MKTQAKLRFVRLSPKKSQGFQKLLSGSNFDIVLNQLKFDKTKASKIIYKVLMQAKKSAEDKNMDINNLYIKNISINQGPTYKRQKIRAKGRVDLIKKKTSHITVILAEKKKRPKKEKAKFKEQNGTKSKPD